MMDINEAKKILTDFEKLNRRRDQLVKIYNAQSTKEIDQLSRKRVDALEKVYEAEMLLIDADPDFYKQWAGRVVGIPEGWDVKQFVESLQHRENILQEAMKAREEARPYGFVVDTMETCKTVYPNLHEEAWRTNIRKLSVLTDDQRNVMLQKSDALISYYKMYEKWAEPIWTISRNVVNAELYTSTAYRILWVLPQKLPRQEKAIHSMLRAVETWQDFGLKSNPFLKLFLASFVIQQHYYYATDKQEILGFDNVCKKASADKILEALKRTAIVDLTETSPKELCRLIIELQPNVIAAPGTISAVLAAMGEKPITQVDVSIGKLAIYGAAAMIKRHDINFLQLPSLTDETVVLQTWTDDVNAIFRKESTGILPKRPLSMIVEESLPVDVPEEKSKKTNKNVNDPVEIIKEAIRQHTCLSLDYLNPSMMNYEKLRLFPCLLKSHVGVWYLIGKEKGKKELRPYRLSDMENVAATDEVGVIEDEQVRPFISSFGVHLWEDADKVFTESIPCLIQLRVKEQSLIDEFRSHPFHFSQEILPKSPTDSDDTSRVFQYTTYLTKELIRYVHSYGSLVEVIAPEALKKNTGV